MVGVAYEASLAMFRMGFGFEASASQTEAALTQMQNVDVVNNSWTYGEAFTDNKNELKSAEFFEALTSAVDMGREGLGTVVVFAAGNYGEDGDSSNYHSFQEHMRQSQLDPLGSLVEHLRSAPRDLPFCSLLLARRY